MDSVSKQLGDFLRLKRAGLTPKDLGLNVAKRRRTPGLRREEVAELAGISVDWYVRLEQGRDSLPSQATAETLAQVLRLNPVERSHLIRLAQGHCGRVFKKETVPTPVVKLIQGLDQPAYVLGARYDILCCNQATLKIFGFLTKGQSKLERNLLYVMFTSLEARKIFVNWEKDARDILESFRSTYDLWASSPEFSELVEKIKSVSPEFNKWWKAHLVQVKMSGEKVLQLEKSLKVKLPYSTFQLSDFPDLKLVLYGQSSKTT